MAVRFGHQIIITITITIIITIIISTITITSTIIIIIIIIIVFWSFESHNDTYQGYSSVSQRFENK